MTVGGRTCTRAHVFPSACHCEPVRTLVRQSVFPAGKLGKLVVLRANSLRLTNSPEVLLSVTPYRRRSGLSRRFAPRNDSGGTYLHPRTRLSFSMSLRTSAHTGAAIRFPCRETWQTGTTLGKFVVLFRIRPRRCFLLCCAAEVTDCHVASLLAMTCRNLPPVRACNYALPAKPAAAYEFA